MARSTPPPPVQLTALLLLLLLGLAAPPALAMGISAMLGMGADIMAHCTKDAPLSKEELTSLCEMKIETENAKNYIFCACVSGGAAGDDGLMQMGLLQMVVDYKYTNEEENKKVMQLIEGCSNEAKANENEKHRPSVFFECVARSEFPPVAGGAKFGELKAAVRPCYREHPMASGQLVPLMKQEGPLDEDQQKFLACMDDKLKVLDRVEEIIANRDEHEKQRIRAAVAKCRENEPAERGAQMNHLFCCFKEEGLTYDDVVSFE